MMAYLTRPKFQNGGPVVPPKKPYTDTQFKKRVDILIQGIYGTGPEYKDLAVREIQKELDKAEQEGVLSRQEGINFLRERKKYYDDYLNEQRKTTDGPLSLPSVEERPEFYKGALVTEGPNTGKYTVKFPGKSNRPTYPAKFVGTQFGTKEEIEKLIGDAKEYAAQRVKSKVNPAKEQGEKTLKTLVDDIFAKKDFKNFKIKLQPSTIASAERKGKTVTDQGGKIPSQYLTRFNKAMEAGPGSDLFKDLMRITERTEKELLELDSKRPKGAVDTKLRSERAKEFGGVDRRLTDEELKEKGRFYKKTRSEKESVGKKYASPEDLERFNTVREQRKDLNKYFINNPDAINNTKFGERIKILLETRLDKDGNIIRRKTDSKGTPLNDEYYKNLAKQGKIFDIFDINKISKGQRSSKFATNLNIAPSQFNSAFIEGQVNKFFKKGGKFHGDTEKLNNIDRFLKDVGVRVDIEDVGRIGADMGVAYDSKTGQFPHIYRTLKKMDIPDELLLKVNPTTSIAEKAGNVYRNVRPAINTFTTMFPGKADNALAAAIDFPMMYLSGAPMLEAAGSAASMFMNNPNLGKAVNLGLESSALDRDISDKYTDEKKFIQRAIDRRQGLESMLQKIPARFKETMSVKDETEELVP
jgi:hypothetical protein